MNPLLKYRELASAHVFHITNAERKSKADVWSGVKKRRPGEPRLSADKNPLPSNPMPVRNANHDAMESAFPTALAEMKSCGGDAEPLVRFHKMIGRCSCEELSRQFVELDIAVDLAIAIDNRKTVRTYTKAQIARSIGDEVGTSPDQSAVSHWERDNPGTFPEPIDPTKRSKQYPESVFDWIEANTRYRRKAEN